MPQDQAHARIMASAARSAPMAAVSGVWAGKHGTRPALLERDFTADRSDERWVADITEFGCRDGKLYLVGIKDLHDQVLAGWSMGERRPTWSSMPW